MQAQGLRPRTKAMYTPLIDMTPSDPITMKSAMLEAKKLTKKAGQTTTLFTADLQIYRVDLNVQWAYPERFGEAFTHTSSWGNALFDELCWCCGGSWLEMGWKSQ